ncbi:MAG TPA: hypothetical protein VMP68_27145 [Candidatus Eisenbacteria bacterium]|nr:hypothetical protein [Candidatus Eisenbacteria bacterium]
MRRIGLLMRGLAGLYLSGVPQLFGGKRVFGGLAAAPEGASGVTMDDAMGEGIARYEPSQFLDEEFHGTLPSFTACVGRW